MVVAALGVSLLALVVWVQLIPPSEGPWVADHARAPTATVRGSVATIHDVRNFDYRSATEFTPRWEDRAVDLEALETVWYVVTPFKSGAGAAHTFLSFGFGDSTYLAVSVEARRAPDEGYSLLRGLARAYEVIYVVGDERDLIGLRAIHREDRVLLYPVRATPDQVRALFRDILDRINELAEEPEFYNTVTNNCTTNILRHVNAVAPEPIRYGPRILFPAGSDALALERGLLDTRLSIEEARLRFDVTERARAFGAEPGFSNHIRSFPDDRPRVTGGATG